MRSVSGSPGRDRKVVNMVNKRDLREGIVKMREVAELLSGWADDMEKSLEAEKESVKEEVVSYSASDVRKVLAEKCALGFRTQVQALINSFGAARFSEVDLSHYAELMEAVGLLGEGSSDSGGDGHG